MLHIEERDEIKTLVEEGLTRRSMAKDFGVSVDEIWTMAVIVSDLTLGLLFIIELFVGMHYENKE